MAVLDQASDTLGSELYRLASLYEPPGFVKAASEGQLRGEPGMPGHCYADQFARRFPVHTAAATWLSGAYFLAKRAEHDAAAAARIAGRLEAAADYWAIRGDFDKLAAAIAAGDRETLAALADDDFALVEAFDDGRVDRRLPLRNGDEVKAAAAWLVRYRDDFRYADRRTVAGKILAKSAAYAAPLGAAGEVLMRIAGFGGCAVKRAARLVRDRAVRLRGVDDEVAGQLDEVVADLPTRHDEWGPETLAKLAAMIDQADRASGLARLYGDALERPEDVLFAVTEKVACDYLDDHVRTQSGALYARDELLAIPARQVRDHCGDAIADALSGDGIWLDAAKLADVLPTMPRDDAELFDRMAASCGVSARKKEAAATRSGVSLADVAAALTATG